jgi:hypothetical protein
MRQQQHDASRAEFQHALHGCEFPVARDEIIRHAQDTGGLDAEVVYVLEHLPKPSYTSMQELEEDMQVVYDTVGGLTGSGPAAPERGKRPPAED